jgi:hypothetical protein
MAGSSLQKRADVDAHVDKCGKPWVDFGRKWAILLTFYRQKLPTSIVVQSIWPCSEGPI